jgi:hypothetical protein
MLCIVSSGEVQVRDDGANKGSKLIGLVHSDGIVNTKTCNKCASVGQVLYIGRFFSSLIAKRRPDALVSFC